jgi:hypothetical protein
LSLGRVSNDEHVTNSLFVLVYTPRQKEDNKTFAFFGKKRKKVQKDGDEEME